MADKTEVPQQARGETEQMAAQRAGERARAARWDLDVAIFLFAVLIISVMLLFQVVTIAIVATVAIVGLGMVWLVGWGRGGQLSGRLDVGEAARRRCAQGRAGSVERGRGGHRAAIGAREALGKTPIEPQALRHTLP